MIICKPRQQTNPIAFIHLHKCSGTTFNESIYSSILGKDVLYKKTHNPVSNIPEEYKDINKYSLVRNPLTWYISYYSFMTDGSNRDDVKGEDISEGQNPFQNALNKRLMTDGSYDAPVSFDEFLNRALDFKSYITEADIDSLVNDGYPFFKHLGIQISQGDDISLYQLFISVMGIRDTKFFRMEDQMRLIKLIFGVTLNQHLNKSNGNIVLTEEQTNKISSTDNELFCLFGY